jgi:[Skp1-protein]-hydroxyproline N-acetylglucosaminyltransferase
MEFDDSQTSVQLAVYPGDGKSGYPKHCDRSKQAVGGQQRIITAVYYLTPPDWNCEEDGGCLRVFCSNANEFYDVVPYSNRMILFRSDIVEHQVLPSKRRDRMALTVWLYGRATNSSTRLGKYIEPQPSVSTAQTSLPPPLVISENNLQNEATIFVSIAAYRDSELGPTVSSLMATALYPERIHVGIVLQVDEEADQTILASLHKETSRFQERVRMLQMNARHARGPCYARDLCQRLYADEDYVLQIDSHMRFRHNWDAFLIQQIQKCPVLEKSMLTTYPVGYRLPNQIPNETRGTLLVPWKFDKDGMLRQRARLLCTSDEDRNNIPTHLYAAGFNFSCGNVIQDCPYDGGLQHLFFGEEVSMALRLFTHGYNLYAPPETVCFHLWSRAHRPAPLDGLNSEMRSQQEKVRKTSLEVVLQQLRGTGRGLGTERTAAEFASAMGVDFKTKSIRPEAQLGGVQAHNFANDVAASFSPDSLESQVTSLDPKVQARIAFFLSAIS